MIIICAILVTVQMGFATTMKKTVMIIILAPLILVMKTLGIANMSLWIAMIITCAPQTHATMAFVL
jgi:hypothetical protein